MLIFTCVLELSWNFTDVIMIQGCYELVSSIYRNPVTGEEGPYPELGAHPRGLLIYTKSKMSVMISSNAGDVVAAYAGTYCLNAEKNVVTHIPCLTISEGPLSAMNRRLAFLGQDLLELSDEEGTRWIRWKKVE